MRKGISCKHLFSSDDVISCTRTYEGGCGNWDAKTLNLNFEDRKYTTEECHGLCLENSECGGFFLGTGTKHCLLAKEGCSDDNNAAWDYYAMADCTSRG